MAEVQQRLLTLAVAAALLGPPAAHARRFYDDDPIWREPAPLPVQKVKQRKLNDYYDFFLNTFWQPDARQRKHGRIPPAGAVNTLGEVPDSPWYENRRLSLGEMLRGAGSEHPPSMDGPWTVISGKNEGITPGLEIKDARGRHYLLKFDPMHNPEMASAADVIGSKFFYALGYNTPENYIVRFTRDQLRVTERSSIRDYRGAERRLDERDIRDVLRKVPRDREGRYRALASLYLEGELIGPFRYHGVRSDDPNDVVPHEDRRDLRGLYVFAAWLNHTDSKALNSLDTIVEQDGVRFIRHYLIDFGAILGSDSFEPKSPRAGNVYLFDFKPAAWQFLSLGLYVPAWMRAGYPGIPAAGNFEGAVFNPEKWKSNYPNPAFDNRLPDDTFWAAKKVMAFTDEQVRALVETGQFSDPRAADWIARVLIERRNRIGRAFFDDVLPLDGFRIRQGRLEFDDLGVRHGFAQPRRYTVQWHSFDNDTGERSPLPGENRFNVPAALRARSGYALAEIVAEDPGKIVRVYVRNRGGRLQVAGLERTW